MATVSPTNFGQERGDALQRELLHDDYVAGRNVCAILISIITAAMVAGMGAVIWIALVAR